jgi:hypothetical protein
VRDPVEVLFRRLVVSIFVKKPVDIAYEVVD